MPSEYDRLMQEISNLRRMVGQMFQPATVKEVGKGKRFGQVRVTMGKDGDKDLDGPWIPTANHYGSGRDHRRYKEKQNIMMLCPGGDTSQAFALNMAQNKDNKTPEHADDDNEAYQYEANRAREKKDQHARWFQDSEDQQQQQQQQQNGGGERKDQTEPEEHKAKPPKVEDAAHYMSKGKGWTGRFKKNRVMAGVEGSKLKADSDFAAVTKGKLLVSKPWQLGKDPVKDDELS